MNLRRPLSALFACAMLLAGCGRADRAADRSGAANGDSTTALDPERAVRRTVRLFGARMQTVSLLAPDSIAASRVQEAYGALVTPDLLSDWMSRPAAAPGRRVSSPWPDRIEVRTVQQAGADEYLVTGALIYESSRKDSTVAHVGASSVRLHVRRGGDGSWRISLYEQTTAGAPAKS